MTSLSKIMWIIFALWFVIIFPDWYHITYTKIWELRRLIGKSRIEQMHVMHPGDMQRLTAFVSYLNSRAMPTGVILPPMPMRPLSQNAPLVRGVLPIDVTIISTTSAAPKNTERFIKITETQESTRSGEIELWGGAL